MTKQQQAERDSARDTLRGWLKPGATVYTILRHVSRSGMSRDVGVAFANKYGEIFSPTGLVAKAIGAPLNKAGDGIKVGGCGFDAGLEVTDALSYALWPKGFTCIGEKCPSREHSQPVTPPTGTCANHATHGREPCTNLACTPWEHSDRRALSRQWL